MLAVRITGLAVTLPHLFEHYRDLEEGKLVRVLDWEGKDAPVKEIMDGIANYKSS